MEFISEMDVEKAAKIIKEGGLVAFPTETVYGLGSDAFNVRALARIFEVKNRPFFDPLIIHIADYDSIFRIADYDALGFASKEKIKQLTVKFWPGPLSLVLPKKKELPDLATAGLPCAAIRFPSHEIAQSLIRLSTGAIAAPSANPFGFLSPTRAEHVKAQLGGKVDCILDSGRTSLGLESTVLDLSSSIPCILRHGGITKEAIEDIIGEVVENPHNGNQYAAGTASSPGLLKNHYAPKTPLVLCSRKEMPGNSLNENEGCLYFSKMPDGLKGLKCVKLLSEKEDLNEAAANLFDMLHELDNMGLSIIYAEKVPDHGLGRAINDRLYKAGGSK